ncbi:MAG: M15 family metallopeptidase, partial [Myxococcaceae bacterium]|nr:M15 family metallopeptidase [Myxococcaceae bacterium]
ALRDLFATRYESGPIKPVVGDDTLEDPGRARIDPLFKATYGSSWREVMSHLAKVKFFGTRYPFHERAAAALERVTVRLEAAAKADPKLLPYFKGLGGTWHWRRIARSRALSTHAFGIAIDLNVERSNYWRWQRPKKPLKWVNRYPQSIVDAFEAEGFIWGGRWIHYDTMHFEYRPELIDPACWP